MDDLSQPRFPDDLRRARRGQIPAQDTRFGENTVTPKPLANLPIRAQGRNAILVIVEASLRPETARRLNAQVEPAGSTEERQCRHGVSVLLARQLRKVLLCERSCQNNSF
jgi:hypothetical protein